MNESEHSREATGRDEPARVEDHPEGEEDPRSSVDDPAELIRIASMIQALHEEVDRVDLDEAGRDRLFEIQRQAVGAIKAVVSEDLQAELDDLSLPLPDDASTPGESELRLAQAQLAGWLDGLFRGIQASVASQQMARQVQQARRQGALQAPEQGPSPASRGQEPGAYL